MFPPHGASPSKLFDSTEAQEVGLTVDTSNIAFLHTSLSAWSSTRYAQETKAWRIHCEIQTIFTIEMPTHMTKRDQCETQHSTRSSALPEQKESLVSNKFVRKQSEGRIVLTDTSDRNTSCRHVGVRGRTLRARDSKLSCASRTHVYVSVRGGVQSLRESVSTSKFTSTWWRHAH